MKKLILPLLIILGFVVRLYKIDNPIADWHSWRQADTSAVTRNWMKSGLDIFTPRYDDLSDVTGLGLYNPQGYRFVEFPLFNIFHYLLATAFPFKPLEFWGRMTAILSSLISAVLLYKLVGRHLPAPCALLACFFFLFMPYNIYFSRVILPDPLMVTLWLGSLLSFDIWLSSPKNKAQLIFSLVLASLAILVKPTAGFFLLPILWQARGFIKNKFLYLCIFITTVPFLLWRTYINMHPEGIPYSFWLLNGNGIRFRPAFFRWLFEERLSLMFLGSWGLWPFLTGVLAAGSYFIVWAIGALLYISVFATGNIQHDYYQIPVIPIVAIFLAIGATKLWRLGLANKILLLVCLTFMFGFSWYNIKGNFNVNRWEIVEAGQAIDRIVPKDAIVVAPYGNDTAFLYQTNRHGFASVSLPIKDLIDRHNATYFVSVNFDEITNTIMKKYTIVTQTPKYVIVKLIEPIRP